ncbi:MAG TPA: benzoate/H(+) symporter BenE family transporter [Spirochaetales bacterium]|nr:benzoate/H(+) symporter BenE family transporter [Spirochaetales bacterium]HOV38504.1 benzoate/H(+) symporter BenE family transporter [Spirochaetales bacterium]
MLNMEKGVSIGESIKDFGKSVTPAGIGVAIAATLFGEGPVFLLLKLLNDAKLVDNLAISWLTIIFIVGGILTVIFALYYRQPVQFAFSIPAIALIGNALLRFQFSDILGAVVLSGIIVLLLGVTGLFKAFLKYIPIPVIQGMIAGALVTYGIAIIKAMVADPVVAGSTFLVFIVFSLIPIISRKFPPILSALVLGFVVALLVGRVDVGTINFSLSSLTFIAPTFNISAIAELTIPLAILTVGFGNIQAIGILKSQGYNPPVNAFVVLSGIGTIINSFFGGHNTVVGGPTVAMMAGPEIGLNEQRYSAAVLAGILMVIMAILSPIVISFTRAVPPSFIDVLAGVAMLTVIANNFTQAFSSNLKMGALFALMITLSQIKLFNIGSTLWAIIGGTLISLLLERKEYLKIIQNKK